MQILPIVEGDGDIAAVPELIRRVAFENGNYDVQIGRPHKRGDLPKVLGRFDDFLLTALLEQSPVLWVLDYDCHDCVDQRKHTRELGKRASVLAGGMPVEFVFMVKEFETLFLADEATTRGVFPDIPAHLQFPSNPEGIRDAKGWLSAARPKGSAYKATSHQKRLTAQLNLATLRQASDSFRRFESAVLRLLKN